MKNLELIKHYFHLSNIWDITSIWKILDEEVSYSSDNTGIHFWKENVLKMKNNFFWGLNSQNWEIKKIVEISERIFRVDFFFTGTTTKWINISKSWRENIIINKWKLRHIEVRNC